MTRANQNSNCSIPVYSTKIARERLSSMTGLGAGRASSKFGRRAQFSHNHVLRNQIVGSTRRLAASGPRFVTVILIRMSSTSALAYSTNTSKYLHRCASTLAHFCSYHR